MESSILISSMAPAGFHIFCLFLVLPLFAHINFLSRLYGAMQKSSVSKEKDRALYREIPC